MFTFRSKFFGLAAFGALAMIGCGGGESSSSSSAPASPASAPAKTEAAAPAKSDAAPAGKNLQVYLLPKKKGVPYFETCNTGAQEAAKELGITVTYDGPASGSADDAAKMIEQWTLKGADVIAVSASDPAVLSAPMKAAQAKGIKVITWDADTAPDSRALFVCQASAEQIGTALAQTLAKDISGSTAEAAQGEVAIVSAQSTAANQNEWIKYIKAELEKIPNLKLVDTQFCDDDQTKAQQQAQDLVKAHPNLKGIFAISSQAFPGVAEGIKLAGKAGQVQITGLSTPNDMKKYVKDGTVKSVVLWSTVDLGYLTVYTADAVATGKYKAGDTTIKAGRLGEKKIEDGKVMLGNILVFNKDNIDQYDF